VAQSRNADFAFLQGLSQGLKDLGMKFEEFVENQNAFVGAAYFSGARRISTAD
jgi:hypothetical protein